MSGSNFLSELRRMARTSGAVGGIAARVAGERMFGIRTDRAAHAEDLRTILGGLKGPLMKVAQFLSTVPDALPAEYAEELRNSSRTHRRWVGTLCVAAWQANWDRAGAIALTPSRTPRR